MGAKKNISSSKSLALIISLFLGMLLFGCDSPYDTQTEADESDLSAQVAAPNLADYPDPPEDQWSEALPIYIEWDGAGGETWDYTFSVAGIVEEGSQPPPKPDGVYEDEDGFLVLDEEEFDLPGGRSIWLKGAAPGDVVITFTTENENGEIVYIRQYTIRVDEGLRLALLHEEHDNFR
jgi:hypothetical protein